MIGRVENSATESMHSGATHDIDHNVLQTATDVMIDRYYHSIAANHRATHDITLFQKTADKLIKGRQNSTERGGGNLPIW